MDLPGPGTVFLNQNWKFTAPVYLDDTITAEAEVLSVHPTKPVTQLRIRVSRQTGEMVLEGEAWCYTFARPESRRPRLATTPSTGLAERRLPYIFGICSVIDDDAQDLDHD